RGDNAQRAQAREKARNSMDKFGIERPATSNRQARDQARMAQSEGSIGNRMQPGRDSPRTSDRSQGQNRSARENPQPRREPAQTSQRRQEVSPNRQGAQQRGAARDNAFAGVRSPSQSNAQALR